MIQESFKPLKSILVELKTKALIIDILTIQAIDVCEELSVPVYSFFTASTILLTFSLYLPTLDSQVEGEFVDLLEAVEVPEGLPIRTNDLLDQKSNLHTGTASKVETISTSTDLEPVTFKALKQNPFSEEISTPPVYPIGSMIKDDEFLTEKYAEIIPWLNNQPTDLVLFINLGSGGTLSSKQLTELAWGLQISQHSAGSDENDPSDYFPDGFVEKTREHGLFIPSWAPQVVVLRHESTGAFLSHCGWNSTLESSVHGVSMIAWPLYTEQRMNATILTKEVGVAMKPVAEQARKWSEERTSTGLLGR
ncbi:anthocyanidin 3-O-glucosyltransferase 5-like [Olea europaea subsp. europaea]|uniref:Anthocyanidin 3-O-glucosyltransferase 5-like n=1 Tax=Olea europaea subsp. europaea TaxID=158383 RepID=A0A8S0T1H8_OLEEU|nr:anthocyanidin 3-O-glucosyltransferase 5-like [Olea europaea subsp. europaea]